jgi:hypothetical protein
LDFEFTYRNMKKKASCTIYTKPGETTLPYSNIIYRVAVEPSRIEPMVFLLYKKNRADKTFWHYEFGSRREIGVAIKETLENLGF